MINMATWNVCLGLTNKKDLVINELRRLNISICCLQEVELIHNYPIDSLATKDYKIEVENNTIKARTAIYIKDNIVYTRMNTIEEQGLGIIIVDINLEKKFRIINLYRVFNPVNGMTQREFFTNQMRVVRNAFVQNNNNNIILTGDFNLDYSKVFSIEYPLYNMSQTLIQALEPFNLTQLVEFPTWERFIRGNIKTSILDHVYVKDFELINNLKATKQIFGDHSLVSFTVSVCQQGQQTVIKRNWRNYSKEQLVTELSLVDFGDSFADVQSCWNSFENNLISIVDKLCPLEPFIANTTLKSISIPPFVKNKMNLRKRLLKRLKITRDQTINVRIKQLSMEIRNHFYCVKRKSIRQGLIPGNSKTLWDSVKIAKNVNINNLPELMTLNDLPIPKIDLQDTIANHFKSKIDNIVNESTINANVYNGKKKLNVNNLDFMDESNIMEAVKSIKLKNAEGYDRIPQRFLIDGISILILPLKILFSMIYKSKLLPEQWLVSKILPIYKKGDKHKIENYRPIANLCSTSKIFEKMILNRLLQIQILNDVDITNKSQHGFKRNHSTNSAGLQLQSVLARALDEGNIALMASLDLSSAFDVVNVRLLLKRMRLLGLPEDIVSLCGNWLSNRFFYVSIGGINSIIHTLDVGTVQGSILGPILYAIFVSPLFDLAKMTKFADDNFIIRFSRFLPQLIIDMQKTLEMIIKWLKDSGLKVNDAKTELCIFSKSDVAVITLTINNFQIKSKTQINVLGVIFDTKLKWNAQIENAIKKANKAKYAISLIRRYFTKQELSNLLTSNFFSILYYNADIWLIPSLKPQLMQHLLSTSSSALRMITLNYDYTISFIQLHSINKRATPTQIMNYKHALLLYKIFNNKLYSKEWLALNFQQTFNARTDTINIVDTSRIKIGKNSATNRLKLINGKITFDSLNLSWNSYKIKCKIIFL